MSIGVLNTGDIIPPALFNQPLQAVRMASLSGLLGLCALGLLLDILEGPGVRLGVTITTPDEVQAKLWEPKASPVGARVRVLKEAKAVGLQTTAAFGPLLPEISDKSKSPSAFAGITSGFPGNRRIGALQFSLRTVMYFRWSFSITRLPP